jgi:hypothetical protein
MEAQAMIPVLILAFRLLIGHAVADFALQTEWMAKFKNWRVASPPPLGQKQQSVWVYVLSSHAMIHGGAVWVATGSATLGLAETVAHWLIDLGKCSSLYGIHEDQTMHLICKGTWLALYPLRLP